VTLRRLFVTGHPGVAKTTFVLLVIVLATSAVACWLRWRDPLAALPREVTGDLPRVEQLIGRGQGRRLTHVTLEGAAVGRIRFVVSLPDPMPEERVPLMVVVAGQGTGAETLSVFGDLGPNAIIWFEWPFPSRVRWNRELARRLPELHRQALSVPGQLDAALRWASQQRWVDRDRVSLMGYSLGALAIPAAQRLAQERGACVGWTVLAYGGAPIGAVLEANLRVGPAWIRPAIGAAVDLLLHPVEPSVHLPEIRGRFLLLGGRADPMIPFEAAERMRRLTPQPRTVILFEGEHIGVAPKKRKLLEPVVAVSQSWLVEQGAIESRHARPVHAIEEEAAPGRR
jgi:pimeloyl-ACP methyl ester carboxylesterase